MADIDVEKILSQLTVKEKVDLLSGIDYWHTYALSHHAVPSLRFTDGPNGARGTKNFNGVPAAAFPCGTAMGSTFNQELLQEVGEAMGRESIAKGAHVLLGPCINIQRSPLGGRGFESISEDPVLSGLAAAAITKGIESTGVAACIKHFVCNDQEHQRTLFNAIITDRALREIYLRPFQIAQRDSKPSTYMTAYNKVNGTHVSENHRILQNILRDEWGFDGLVMSDWFGTYSTTEAITAGLDLEMPGPTRWRNKLAAHAVNSGKFPHRTLNERARNVLKLVKRCVKSGVPESAPEKELNTPETAALLRRIATESIVLLKNDNNVLPLSKTKSTLVIGPHAKSAIYCGGGSSALRPYYVVSPWDAISKKVTSPDQNLNFTLGTHMHKELPLLGPQLIAEDGKIGFNFRVYNEPPSTPDRKIAEDIQLDDSFMLLQDFSSPRVPKPLWYATLTGTFIPAETGTYDFGLCVYGTADLYVDDKMLIENSKKQRQGTQFYGTGTVEEKRSLELVKGKEYKVRVEFASAPTNTLGGGGIVRFGGGGLRVGCAMQIDADEEMGKAVELAGKVDQVIVVAGMGPDWEGEGHDRKDMKLPGRMDDLISKVAKVNQQTVVVLQTGMPVEMPWLSDVNAVMEGWYLGNEAGNALADVLYGDSSPSGKLSVSFPIRIEDNPAYLNYRSEGGRTLYGEDVYVGYRWYESVKRDVAFPFGHGLTYSTFELGEPKVSESGKDIVVEVELHNTGSTDAAEVVQVYVAPIEPPIRRPLKELQGFAKKFVKKGGKEIVKITMEKKYASSYWDETEDQWRSEAGTYDVLVGTNSVGPFKKGSFVIDETLLWKGL